MFVSLDAPQMENGKLQSCVGVLQFRPTYPQQLYDTIHGYAQLPKLDVCLDVATGQGQAAVELAKR